MDRRWLAVGAALACALGTAAPAAAAPYTTIERTIFDCRGGDNLLEYAPGEGYRFLPAAEPPGPDDECDQEQPGPPYRLPNTHSILNFLQLSDFQIVDEESPGRVEFLDHTQRNPFFSPIAAAYRPQESLTTQVEEAMVRQARNTTSPVTGEPLDLTILTGDNADSQQYNETRWFIDTLDGTTGPGNPDPEMDAEQTPGADRKIDPDSGIPNDACPHTSSSIYDGVRDNGNPGFDAQPGYYEPDSSAPPRDDGDGYSPSRQRNLAETPGRDITLRDFPGLLEEANEPFEAVGLGMPWYSAFGNHDALIQGNSPDAYGGPFGTSGEVPNQAYQIFVTGCLKPSRLPPALESADPRNFDQERIRNFFSQFFQNPRAFLEDCAAQQDQSACSTSPLTVPPDPRRCYLAKDDLPLPAGSEPPPCNTGSWIAQHFRSTGAPVGHGFAPTSAAACEQYANEEGCREALSDEDRQEGLGRPPTAIANHDGYYSFRPRDGLRFVVLDTITDECGSQFCSEGSVDDAQFEWLREQITDASGSGEYVMVFSHHTLRTTRFPSADGTEYVPGGIHYGQRRDRDNPVNPQNPVSLETLEDLYCKHPNVLAHIAGHEHENYVQHYDCKGPEATSAVGPGDFWHVSTAAHIDWPQQARMIELVTERDGTMSLVLTMLDHAGPAYPGGPQPERQTPAQGQAGDQVPRLAAIARELGYNDYQQSRGSRGDRADRNVIIRLGRPFPCPETGPCPPPPSG